MFRVRAVSPNAFSGQKRELAQVDFYFTGHVHGSSCYIRAFLGVHRSQRDRVLGWERKRGTCELKEDSASTIVNKSLKLVVIVAVVLASILISG